LANGWRIKEVAEGNLDEGDSHEATYSGESVLVFLHHSQYAFFLCVIESMNILDFPQLQIAQQFQTLLSSIG